MLRPLGMFDPPLHPKLVHLPLGIAVLLPLLLLALSIAIRKDWLPPRAYWLGALVALVGASSGWFALRAGEADEEVVEQVVAKSLIEAHEEAGEQFAIAATVGAALTVVAAALRLPRLSSAAQAAALLASIATLALGVRAGQLGGELVYRHGAAAAHTERGAAPAGDGARDRGSAGSAALGRDDDADEHGAY